MASDRMERNADALMLDYGDRVTYVDNDGEHYNALVVAPCPGDPYITVATGVGPRHINESYNSRTEDHSSVYPHTELGVLSTQATETQAFKPGWTVLDD